MLRRGGALVAPGLAACNLALVVPGGSGVARSRDDVIRSRTTPGQIAAPQAAARALEHARCAQPNSPLRVDGRYCGDKKNMWNEWQAETMEELLR